MKFENTQVWGFQHAIRGMRNPLESWSKSDSRYVWDREIIPESNDINTAIPFEIGENDMNLCKRLISGGSEHRKFLRQIFVSVDITAPLYWWKEFDTYKVGTVANSTSTMHKLATTPITLGCFDVDDLNQELVYHTDDTGDTPFDYHIECLAESIIEDLERLRKMYLKTKDKRLWKELVRWLPEGWLQTRTVTLNYENLLTIYHQRKSHKLNEWSGQDDNTKPNFIAWMLDLPYMRDFISAVEKS